MPTYIHLVNYTREGIENVGEPDPRPSDVIASLGAGELVARYLTFGRYDVVAITEFPDDETAARFALTMAGGGRTRSETLKAFSGDQFEAIVEGLPG